MQVVKCSPLVRPRVGLVAEFDQTPIIEVLFGQVGFIQTDAEAITGNRVIFAIASIEVTQQKVQDISLLDLAFADDLLIEKPGPAADLLPESSGSTLRS